MLEPTYAFPLSRVLHCLLCFRSAAKRRFRNPSQATPTHHFQAAHRSAAEPSQASQIHKRSTDPNRSIVEDAFTYICSRRGGENEEEMNMKVVKNFPFQPQPHLLRVGAVLISIQDLFRGDGIGYSFVLSFGHSALSTPNFLRFVNALSLLGSRPLRSSNPPRIRK